MSYNQLEADFFNRLETEPEENEVEEGIDGTDQTNLFVFNRYKRIL